MNTREKRHAFLYRNISSILMVFAVTYALSAYFALEISPLFLLLAAVAADILIAILDRLKKKAALWLGLAGVLLLAAVVLEIAEIPVRGLLQDAGDWIGGAVQWFRDFTAGEEELLPEAAYVLFFACAGTAAATLVFYPLTFHLYSRIALAGAALVAVVVLPFLGMELGKFPLACVGLCVISSLIELVNLQFDRQRRESKRNAGLFLYPVTVLLILISILLPARETPIRWQAVRDMIDRISFRFETLETNFKIWFGGIPEDFSITFGGLSFTEEGGGGSVSTEEKSVLLRVSTNGITRSPAYLRGSVSSTYTGSGWKDESARYFTELETKYELWEIMYSMLRSGLVPEKGEDLYRRATLFIEFDDMITKSLLYGAPLSQLDVDRNTDYSASAANLRFRRMQKLGLLYSMTYFETNWGSPTLTEYLRSLNGFRYVDDHTDFDSLKQPDRSPLETLYVMVNAPDPDFYDAQVAERLADRARTIREVYTQLPDTVPDRVYDLAREITADCETTYDKIIAIEDYFQEGYTYTLAPSAFPEGQDFADWFFFDCSEGYCTYFATAATVLARCAGIPARYVEGMLVPYTLRTRDVAELTNLDVHAWTEVYLEGYGWITIEPTPGYGVGRREEWKRRNGSGVVSELVTHDTIPQEEIEPQPEVKLPEIDFAREAELKAQKEQHQAQMRRLWQIAALAALGVITIVLLTLWLVLRRMKAVRYNRAKDDDKIRLLMREVIRCVSITGIHMREDETLLEYVERAGMGFDYSDMRLSDAAMLFMKVRYAEKHAARSDVLAMYRYTRELRRETLKHQNIFRRAWFAVWQVVQ